MTISSTYAPVQYTGNGVTTVFAFQYEFYNSTDLTVKSTVIATGVTTTLTSPTDYSVSGGLGATGNVTFVVAPASTVRITIERSIPYTQGQDYQENTAFPAATIETGFDKSVIMAQQTKALTDYALKFETTDPPASIGTIPNSVARANAILSFDSAGKPAAVTLASLGSSINVSLTSPQNGDALVYNAGVWNNRSVLASLGTNIASATTTAISAADSDFVTVTGTTTITSFGTPASFARKHIWVVFAGALTLTHNATSLILPGGASITTAVGDVAECVHISGANWRVVTYQKASGAAIVSPTLNSLLPTQTGNAGKVLVTDGTNTSWSGGNWEKCGSVTVSGSVVDVRFIDGQNGVTFNGTYKSYLLVFNGLYTSGATLTFDLQFATAGGASPTFATSAYEYSGKGRRASGGTDVNLNGTAAAAIRMSGTVNTSEDIRGFILFPQDPTNVLFRKQLSYQVSYQEDTTNALEYMVGAGVWNSAAVIFGFRLLGAANVDGGFFTLYGMK